MASGYYLTTDSPINIREFPIAERPGSSPLGRRAGPISRENTDLVHETEEGLLWVYEQSTRKTWELTYRCTTEAQLEFFETLHDTVDGQRNAFYFIPDVDESPMQTYLVRKEKDFQPQGISTPTVSSGTIIGIYDYTLRLREESTAAQILA